MGRSRKGGSRTAVRCGQTRAKNVGFGLVSRLFHGKMDGFSNRRPVRLRVRRHVWGGGGGPGCACVCEHTCGRSRRVARFKRIYDDNKNNRWRGSHPDDRSNGHRVSLLPIKRAVERATASNRLPCETIPGSSLLGGDLRRKRIARWKVLERKIEGTLSASRRYLQFARTNRCFGAGVKASVRRLG